jgi:hypothetical protein
MFQLYTRSELQEMAARQQPVRMPNGTYGYMTHLPSPEDGPGWVYVQGTHEDSTRRTTLTTWSW